MPIIRTRFAEDESWERSLPPSRIATISDPADQLRCDALVDVGASHMVLPSAGRDRLGDLEDVATIMLETATQATVEGSVCGPVRIEVERFRPISTEVMFVDMTPDNGAYEPLIGSVVLDIRRRQSPCSDTASSTSNGWT